MTPNRISPEQMEALVVLFEESGHVSGAAARLGVNASAISKRLKVFLEPADSSSHPWVEKKGREFRLTAEGKEYFPAIREIVERYRVLEAAMVSQVEQAPQVSFGCGQLAAVTYVREGVMAFRRDRSDVSLRLLTVRGRDRIRGVVNGGMDFAIVSHTPEDVERLAGRSLELRPLRTDPLVITAGRRAPRELRDRFAELPNENITPEMILDLPLVVPEPDSGFRRMIDRAWDDHRDELQRAIQMEAGGWSVLLGYVAEGIGAGIATANAAGEVAGLMPTKRLDPQRFPPLRSTLISRGRVDANGNGHTNGPVIELVRRIREAAERTNLMAEPEGL